MHLPTALDQALAAVLLGSNTMMTYYRGDYRVEYKGDEGADEHERIFTEADLRTQEIVVRHLKERTWPEVGILAEEDEWSESRSRFERDHHWQIDPIDGTKGFKKETDNFGISVALVNQKGVSRVGVMKNPARNLLAWASEGGGAFLNGRPIHAPASADGALKVIVSANQVAKPAMRAALDLFPGCTVLTAESNVTKAIRVFSGEADVFFGLPGVKVCLWDLAAVSVIAREAGFSFTDFGGNPIHLNVEDTVWPAGFVLTSPTRHAAILRTLQTL